MITITRDLSPHRTFLGVLYEPFAIFHESSSFLSLVLHENTLLSYYKNQKAYLDFSHGLKM